VRVTFASATYRLIPPSPDEIVNPVACGDCMAAGIAWAVRDGRKMVDAVKFGIAAAGDNLRELLPSRLDLKRVEKRVSDVRVEEG